MLRLAHLTDLHLRESLPGTSPVCLRRSRGGLQRLAQALNQIVSSGAHCIAITGDLLDVPEFLTDGMPPGFTMPAQESWSGLAAEDYRAIRTLLDQTGLPYCVLPGNHDCGPTMAEVFRPAPYLDCQGYRLAAFWDYEGRDHVPRRFAPARFLFEELMSDKNSPPQIHLQHYLLHPVPSSSYPFAYAEYASLRAAMERCARLRLVLSGHFHEGTGLAKIGDADYCVGTAFCEYPYRWRMLEIDRADTKIIEHALMPSERTPLPAVFLDRDGVINDEPSYSWGPERFRLIPGSARAIRKLNTAGVPAVVVTSQSCIGKGYVPEAVVKTVHETMHHALAAEGAYVDAVYFTAGAGEESVLEKYRTAETKKAAIVRQAARELNLSLEASWLIGDRLTDIEAAVECGVAPMLASTGDGAHYRKATEGLYPQTLFAIDAENAIDRILSRHR